jgi:hypothetical protein
MVFGILDMLSAGSLRRPPKHAVNAGVSPQIRMGDAPLAGRHRKTP